MSRKDILNYPEEYYYPEALKEGALTAKEMRAEYSRLRTVANKRLERFKGTKYEDSQSYIKNANKFVRLKDIENERDLIYKLYELKKFVTAKSSSVSGMREIERKTLETAHDRGLTWLNAGNLQSFGAFMEECRAKGYARLYGSERCAQLFGTAAKKGLDPAEVQADFNYWMQNREALENAPKFRNKDQRTSENYKERLNELEKKKRRR